jgi:D-3-phosphoglycerate dehydrogenase / 2-oxoglutarate reductase
MRAAIGRATGQPVANEWNERQDQFMLKVVVSDHGFPSLDLERKVLESAGFELIEIQPNCKTEEDVIARCGEADVLLVQWAPITRHVLQSLPKLKGVVRYGIGVDNIDLNAARELGIGVANVPTYCLEEVSNHALAFMLSLARRIPQDHYGIAHGGWGIGPLLPIPSFLDMTLGLVGFGAIARRVAQKARCFGFRIVAADPFLSDSVFTQNGVERVALEALLASADIISLHCPLVPETAHLIRRETIQTMKPGVLIINTARGPIIREVDLIEALTSGRVLGAGLDVFEKEPLPADSPLGKMPNVLLTSHAASVSSRAVVALQTEAAEAARDFLEGKRPQGKLV